MPTVADLREHPARALELPATMAADLLGACEAELVQLQRLRDTLLIRAVTGAATSRGTEPGGPDLFDSIDEAARLIGRTPHFIYRNHRALPFVVQEGRGRRLRFSRSAIERFLAENQGG